MYTNSWHSRYNLNSRLKAKFRRKLATYQKKNPDIIPFSLESKTLAASWWAKAWNTNLKKYTFNNLNLEKGKLNFRCEALADLRINGGWVNAVVLGSNIKPYEVKISMKPISMAKWTKIKKLYDGNLEAFDKIMDNYLPKEMMDIFTSKHIGLFPSLDEITFECTCSTRANLCKHTAVVLYALGAKIDDDVNLLFSLRGVEIVDLVSSSIHAERKNILKKARTKSSKVLKNVDLSSIFNIEIQQR